MPRPLEHLGPGRRALLIVATDLEARAIPGQEARTTPAAHPWRVEPLDAPIDLVISGIGKANAAGAAARCLDPARHSLVLNLGIAGSLPLGGSMLEPGRVVVASSSVFADEGVATPDGFRDLPSLGFALGGFEGCGVSAGAALLAGLREALAAERPEVGPIATVSTCSGTDALAREVARRTGAIAEAMEGAAVASVAARVDVPFGEVRAISNRTGDRARQGWDIPAALGSLRRVIGHLLAGARVP